MATAFIGLGSNIGNREWNLRIALERLEGLLDTDVVRVSQFHETDPVGGPPQGKYLNAVVQLQTAFGPEVLLKRLQEIEQLLGRPLQHLHWGPRVIDLDLLLFEKLVLETSQLTLPHPRMHERPFVLLPLAELAPEWRHPTLGKTVRELLEQLDRFHPLTLALSPLGRGK